MGNEEVMVETEVRNGEVDIKQKEMEVEKNNIDWIEFGKIIYY